MKTLLQRKFIKETIRYFPVLYVCVLIYGYINSATFYHIIGIDITKFITIGELLFPGITTIDLILFISVIFLVSYLSETMSEDDFDKEISIPNKSEVSKKKLHKWHNIARQVIRGFIFFFPIFLGALVYISNSFILKSAFIQNLTKFYGVLVLFLLFIFNERLKRLEIQVLIVLFTLYGMLCIIYYQTIRGNLILQNSPEYSVEFDYRNMSVQSNDTLVYYGKTYSYLFMRDLAKEKTIVYNLDFVSSITFQKLKERNIGIFWSAKRDMTNHPIYTSVNRETELQEAVIQVKRLNKYFIINNKFILAKTLVVQTNGNNPNWINNDNLLYNVDPPYFIMKDKNSMVGYIIKQGDTLELRNGKE